MCSEEPLISDKVSRRVNVDMSLIHSSNLPPASPVTTHSPRTLASNGFTPLVSSPLAASGTVPPVAKDPKDPKTSGKISPAPEQVARSTSEPLKASKLGPKGAAVGKEPSLDSANPPAWAADPSATPGTSSSAASAPANTGAATSAFVKPSSRPSSGSSAPSAQTSGAPTSHATSNGHASTSGASTSSTGAHPKAVSAAATLSSVSAAVSTTTSSSSLSSAKAKDAGEKKPAKYVDEV